MRLRRPSIAETVVAAACGLWVGLFLVPTTAWAIPTAAAAAASTLLLPQRPLTAGAGLAALQWALAFTHVTDDNPAFLAPVLIAVYALGRHAPLWPGVAVALAIPLSSIVESPPPSATLVFALLLTASVFAYGLIVQRRARTAEHSRATATRLQSTDAASVAASIVADERARLGGQALALLRDAVEGMRSDAASAKRDLDIDLIESIAARGRQAVTELRWLLGLLRAAPAPTPATAPRRRTRWVVDIGVAAVLLALCVVEVGTSEVARSSPLAWTVAVGLPVCTLGRNRLTAPALGGAAVVVGFAAIGWLPFIATALLCIVLLAWSAGVAGRPIHWACLSLLAAATIAWVAVDDPQNVPITVALIALPAFAGHEWSAHDRSDRAARARADELRANLDARIDDARREERLRIARDLHDVASHAVGVMVLQASAVRALRDGDPAAARQALSTIDTTAEQALTELAMMFDLLDSGAIGSPGLAGAARDPLPAMVDRLRSTGLQIVLEAGSIPSGLEDTVYRIVQESLTNVVRHSDAMHVRISVEVEEGVLSVRVVDDGHAIDRPVATDGIGGGFGLAGMAERVHELGGAFRAGREARGFAVEATMPVEPMVRS
ncbi:histidine kinase [Agromyces sp. SYSU K20354]|uniref:sensor histidine kinase n=1 Tax=Agromyces cavernae TaxID=2898659 RepID=UPI001E4A1237|nr:histidine kinase [Agromyces cavernae]MCD2441390.1 histidine kinase [Agromyces cavernae]